MGATDDNIAMTRAIFVSKWWRQTSDIGGDGDVARGSNDERCVSNQRVYILWCCSGE